MENRIADVGSLVFSVIRRNDSASGICRTGPNNTTIDSQQSTSRKISTRVQNHLGTKFFYSLNLEEQLKSPLTSIFLVLILHAVAYENHHSTDD